MNTIRKINGLTEGVFTLRSKVCLGCGKPIIADEGYRFQFGGDKTPKFCHKACFEGRKAYFRFEEEKNESNSAHDQNLNATSTINHTVQIFIPVSRWNEDYGLRLQFADEKVWSLRPLGRVVRLTHNAEQKSNYSINMRTIRCLMNEEFKIRINGEDLKTAEDFKALTKK